MFEVFQNGPDGVRIGDIRDDPQRAAAVRTDGNVDFKHLPKWSVTRRSAQVIGVVRSAGSAAAASTGIGVAGFFLRAGLAGPGDLRRILCCLS